MRSAATVLFVSGNPAETSVFERILGENMVLRRVENLAELKTVMANGDDCDAVLCGFSFRQGEWKDALRYVLQGSPDFPLVISRRMGAEREWVEVIGAGAFELLPIPHAEGSVLMHLEEAVASYETRHWKDVLQRRLSPKPAGQERRAASMASGALRGGTRRVFHLRQVPDARVGV